MQPVSPSWKPISWKGAPKGKDGTVALSAGDRVLVLVDTGDGEVCGGWYHPSANRWEKLLAAPELPYRFRPALAWTGSEVLLWGGRNSGPKFFADGARLDHAGRWEPLPKRGAPTARSPHAVWTGDELLVWGGTGKKILGDGVALRPGESGWRPINAKGAPTPREDASAIWMGRELWIYGGSNENDDGFDGEPYPDGAAYDPAGDRWRALPDLPGDAVREPAIFATQRGVVLLETSELSAWQLEVDGKTWKRMRLAGKPGIEGAENVAQVRDRLVVSAPRGMAVLDLASGEWLAVPKSPDLGRLDSGTWVAHRGELVALDGKMQKGARLELYR